MLDLSSVACNISIPNIHYHSIAKRDKSWACAMYAGGNPSSRPIRRRAVARFYRAAGYVPLYDGGGIAVKYAGIPVDGVLFAVYLVEGTQTVVFERGDIDG